MDVLWYAVIGISALLLIVIAFLVWCVVANNKIVVLKKKVDRHYPVLNSKIKQYCNDVVELVSYSEKKLSKTESSEKLMLQAKDCLKESSILKRIELQNELSGKVKDFITYIKGKKEIKAGRKLKEFVESLNKIQTSLEDRIESFNTCVATYNKKRGTFPSNLMSSINKENF